MIDIAQVDMFRQNIETERANLLRRASHPGQHARQLQRQHARLAAEHADRKSTTAMIEQFRLDRPQDHARAGATSTISSTSGDMGNTADETAAASSAGDRHSASW